MKRLFAFIIAASLCFPSIGALAWWQSIQQVGVGTSSATLAFQQFASESAASTTSTYTSVSFGSAASNRVIAIVAIARIPAGIGAISSATIGGIAATQVTSAAAAINNDSCIDTWYASVPAGATGTIVVNWTQTTARTGIYVYSILTSTPTPSNGANTSSLPNVTSLTQTISIPTNGVGVAGVYTRQTGNTMAFTNATQDSSNALPGPNQGTESGHTIGTGSISVTGSATPTANIMLMSLASWGP